MELPDYKSDKFTFPLIDEVSARTTAATAFVVSVEEIRKKSFQLGKGYFSFKIGMSGELCVKGE